MSLYAHQEMNRLKKENDDLRKQINHVDPMEKNLGTLFEIGREKIMSDKIEIGKPPYQHYEHRIKVRDEKIKELEKEINNMIASHGQAIELLESKLEEQRQMIEKMKCEFNCVYFANECAGKITETTVCPCDKWTMKQ